MKTSLIALALGLCGALVAPASAASTFTVTDLGTLGGAASWAYGINNNGQVAGAAAHHRRHAARHTLDRWHARRSWLRFGGQPGQ